MKLVVKGDNPFKFSGVGTLTKKIVSDKTKAIKMVSALEDIDEGYFAYIALSKELNEELIKKELPCLVNISYTDDLHDGFIVSVNENGQIRTLFRPDSEHNTIFTTDACNSNCLMCSQPPKEVDPLLLYSDICDMIDLIPPETDFLGITGGEPTLMGDKLLHIVERLKTKLPNTTIHMLTNGRTFSDPEWAKAFALVGHPDFLLCIPLYSDLQKEHDYVVQAKGAYEETVKGLMNLAEYKVNLEIRVVLHKQTYKRLPDLCKFITMNLPFVSHVALMGMEMMGYVRMNYDTLWIDPVDYDKELTFASQTLRRSGMPFSIYNLQRCLVDKSLWKYMRQSISDWKNIYLDECNSCDVKEECGGLFASAKNLHSENIKRIQIS